MPATIETAKRRRYSLHMKNPVQMAVIGAAHGIKGEVRVKSFTADPQALGDYGPLHTRDGRVAYLFQGCTVSGRWWLEENVLCYAYPSVTGDMKHCFWLRQTRGQLEYWSVSEPQAQTPTAVTIDNLTGNSDNLALGADGPCEAI